MEIITEETSIRKEYAWVRILIMLIPYFFIVGGTTLATYWLLGLDITDTSVANSSWQDFTLTLSSAISTIFVVWVCRKYVDKESFSSLGLNIIIKKDIIYGVLLGLLIMSIAYTILLLAGQIEYLDIQFSFSDFIAGLLMFILVAVLEEILCRGYILTNLMDSMNKYQALLISSLIFSIMHAGNPNFGWIPLIDLFLAGILLGLSYIYTRNLWFPIALHFSWNFFQGTLFGFKVSGTDSYTIIQQTNVNDTIWNGGGFGFEGSILSLIIQVFAIAYVYFQFNKRGESDEHLETDTKNAIPAFK